MPWIPDDAPSHTKKASTAKLRAPVAGVANKILDETGDEDRVVREANAVIARAQGQGDASSW